MAITMNIIANNAEDLKDQLVNLLASLFTPKVVDTMVKIPEPEEIAPVISMNRQEENLKTAPQHELPPIPDISEVRDALKKLRDRKGAEAVKAILKEYGANSVPELKQEDYLPVRDRALVEV